MKNTIILIFLIVFYMLVLIPIISWGGPNVSHPFTYQMDEWHQLMAVKGVLTQGSPNIPGAAHGPMFFFFLSGLYLGLLSLFHIIDPFVIKSSLSSLEMQEKIFVALRFSTLLFGIGSLILVWKICRKYLSISPVIPTVLFLLTPIWMMLSNYFKYDIALIFWMLLGIYAIFSLQKNFTRKRMIIVGSIVALSIATKISAAPLIFVYIAGYYLLVPQKKRKLRDVVYGLVALGITFCFVGIPDLFFRTGDYFEYFYSNIVSVPGTTENFLLPPVFVYMPFVIYPLLFGHGLYLLFLASLVNGFFVFLHRKTKKVSPIFLLLFFALCIFGVSLIPLKLFAGGNRALVLLPFIILFVGWTLQQWLQTKKTVLRKMLYVLIGIVFLIQGFEVFAWLYIRYGTDPRIEASKWLVVHLPQSQTIGMENIPIYQYLPDIVLKEYYLIEQNPHAKTYFRYEVISDQTKKLPKTILISDAPFTMTYLQHSPKKALIARLKKEGYREIKRFEPAWKYYTYFASERDLDFVTIMVTIPLSIYQK